jgi:hypothetical protein
MFMRHYGFTYESQVDIVNYPALVKQDRAVSRVVAEVSRLHKFGCIAET